MKTIAVGFNLSLSQLLRARSASCNRLLFGTNGGTLLLPFNLD
jgi:hypothetical protein